MNEKKPAVVGNGNVEPQQGVHGLKPHFAFEIGCQGLRQQRGCRQVTDSAQGGHDLDANVTPRLAAIGIHQTRNGIAVSQDGHCTDGFTTLPGADTVQGRRLTHRKGQHKDKL